MKKWQQTWRRETATFDAYLPSPVEIRPYLGPSAATRPPPDAAAVVADAVAAALANVVVVDDDAWGVKRIGAVVDYVVVVGGDEASEQ